MQFSRHPRAFLLTALALGWWLCSTAWAEAYPARPLRLLVPYGASGGPDLLARTVANKLSTLAGQAVMIDNRAGASGQVGTGIAAKTASDGYTLLVGDTGPLSIAPELHPSLSFDPARDFIPVSLGVTAPLLLAVNANLGVNSVQQLIGLLKAKPDLAYGSTGIGSVHHLAMEQFFAMTGTRMRHIPYTSLAQSVPALLNGEIDLLIAAYPAIRQHLGSGRLRALAVGTANRAPFAPTVPTVAESGVPGYAVQIDVGFLVPAGTPRAIVEQLNGWIRQALAMPDVTERLTASGLLPQASSSEAFARTIRDDRERFGKLIRTSCKCSE
jgi:tripartite-type tricarboxylate transporter receptor subunit TctC